MKLKIVHQNQESRSAAAVEPPAEPEMEATEVELLEKEMPIHPSTEDESAKEDSPAPEAQPVSGSHPLLVSGKRKRKPKELIDEVSPIIRRAKKTSYSKSYSKSKNGTPDSGGTSMSKGDANVDGSSSSIQWKSPTLLRAEEVQMSLSNEHPSVLKVLVRSHVGSCFWMGLPVPFCKMHLPSKDCIVVLENENGEEFPIKYIANKTGLSAGWRKYCAATILVEGDVLIFQLIAPCRFKVYVIRANDLPEVDGALSLLILDSQTKQNDQTKKNDQKKQNDQTKQNDADATIDAQTKKRRPKSLPLTVVEKKKDSECPLRPHQEQISEESSENDSDEVASEILEDAKSNGSSLHFKDVKSFEEFHIIANGACLDSELPEDIRRTYYELCCSKNAYLHERVLPGLYGKLAAGMIAETINIAEFIRGCKLTTPRKDFEVREKSLRSFELLGLNVGFLRARLRRLQSLAYDSEGGIDVRRYLEAQEEKNCTEEEIWKLETKLEELKELAEKFTDEVESYQVKAESFEIKFQEEVDAPW